MEWINGFWGGLLIPIAAGGLIAIIAGMMKRANLYHRFYVWGTALRKLGFGYDIPVVGGDQETKMKEIVFTSLSDAVRGFARGLAGKLEAEIE